MQGRGRQQYFERRVWVLVVLFLMTCNIEIRLEREAEIMRLPYIPNKTYSTRRRPIQVNPGNRNTAISYDMTYTALTLCPHLPPFLRGRVGVFICKHKTSCCSNTSPQPPPDITNGGTSPWETSSVFETNGDHLEEHQFTIKTFNPSANAMHLLPSPCGIVQI